DHEQGQQQQADTEGLLAGAWHSDRSQSHQATACYRFSPGRERDSRKTGGLGEDTAEQE
ncbi:hypothetical protein NDU88_003653, partial [Pleurodeles waltl]